MVIRKPLLGLSALAALSLAPLSCQGPSYKGTIMVVVQTDMSMSKDLDQMLLRVTPQNAESVYVTLGPTLGVTEGAEKIPGTVAVYVSEDPKKVVTFELAAWQGEFLRTYRKAVTTIPENRVAMLRMPAQWLCDGQATQTLNPDDPLAQNGTANTPGKYVLSTTCPQGQTCINGLCQDEIIDSSTLPDYSDDEVFGGGTGNGDGTCFDTVACFANGRILGSDPADNFDLDNCTFESGGEQLNVALLAEGDGICGQNGCFIPLDAKSDLGWQFQSSTSVVQLPLVACKKLKGDPDVINVGSKVVGIAVAPADDAGGCSLKLSSKPTCGPWSSTGDPPVVDDTKPLALVQGQARPIGLAIDAAHGRLYWSNQGTSTDGTDGEIKAISIQGGSPVVIRSGELTPKGISIRPDGARLFWATRGLLSMPEVADGALLRLDLPLTPGGALDLQKLPTAQPVVMAQGLGSGEGVSFTPSVTIDKVFFTDFVGGSVFELSAGATLVDLPNAIQPADNTQNPYRVAFGTSDLYWTNVANTGTGSIGSAPINGGAASVFVSGLSKPRSIAVLPGSPDTVVWAQFGTGADGEVWKKAGAAAPVKLAGNLAYPNGVAVDTNGDVYFSERGTPFGKVSVIKASDQTTTVIADNQPGPGEIVMDATYIYWINEASSSTPSGSIIRLKKP